MASAVTASGGLHSAQQSWERQLRVQQAQRNAQQAEQQARALQIQAAEARQVADRAEENARALEVKSDQANDNAGRARLGLATLKSVDQMQDRLMRGYERIAETQQTASVGPAQPTKTVQSASITRPAVNAQGQMTGTLLSVAV